MKFAQPAWLILLALLPLLGAGAVAVARLRRNQWSAFVAPRLRGALLKSSSLLPRWFALLFLLTACAALVIALARPQGEAGTRPEKVKGRNLLIALDLSRSMRVRDVKPDRLSQAKMVIYELLDAMPNDRVGLLGFAGAAYLYAPLTVDHAAVRETVEQIDENWAPMGGSNLAEALHLATDTLKKTGQRDNALVILSDGEKHEGNLDAMIAEAKRAGVFVLAIGVGTEDGDYVPNSQFPNNQMVDRSGKPVISRLQPEVLRKLAAQTNGRFAIAGSGVDVAQMVESAVKDLDAFEVEGRQREVFVEFYQWLVLPAILFLFGAILAATRWRVVKTAAAASAALVMMPGPARGDETGAARDALQHQRFEEARDDYAKLAEKAWLNSRAERFHLGEGTAAYHAGDYQTARSAYSNALRSTDPRVRANAHTGLGNTLFQMGWKELSGESYPTDPTQLPDLHFFDSLVKHRLAELRNSPASSDDGGDNGYARFGELITNWCDAVRHYDSAAGADPADAANRKTTMIYLRRLAELMEEDRQQTEQALPPPQPEQMDPKQNPEEGEEPSDANGSEGDNQGDQGPKPNDQGNKKPDNGDEQQQDQGGKKPDEKKDGKQPDQGAKPDETPEDRARRILKENADLEKGPLAPGRHEFRAPQQDW